ncbi:unnamed protein product [Periconia digitata]|uniref:C2H2-type domain-containing protein n=1 Tax=Periconia digitata TaxID=1303443 RepID=A0A9W4XWQ0_9PLEO|nr:unnamed protein product [Periconia digitata]
MLHLISFYPSSHTISGFACFSHRFICLTLHKPMLNSLHHDASSTTPTEPAFQSSFSNVPSSRIAPQNTNSASTGRPDDELPSSSFGAAEETEAAGLLQGSVPDDDALAGITGLSWSDGQQNIMSFDDIWSLGHLSLDTSSLESHPASLTSNDWPQDWPYEFGTTDESAFYGMNSSQLQQTSLTAPSWTENNNSNDLSNFSYESMSPTYPADPATPSSPLFIASVYERERPRRDSNSSRMSRSTSQISSRSSASETLKRRINPLKLSKATPRESNDNFPCDTCKRPFRYKKDLERHRFSIHDRRPSWFCPALECRFAKQGFSRKDKAFQHVKTHRSNSDAILKPIFAAEGASLRSIGSAPVSPRITSEYHRSHTPLREREEQDRNTLS